MKRTHLPLNGLRVLDAAARHLSFTRAADELAVTPAAVGQQIRALEDTLGVVLFRRTTRGLELTPEGERGLTALRDGFLQFEEAVRAMQAGQSSRSLTIAAPRDLTQKWLMPRLSDIARADPEQRFTLVAAEDGVDFA
ncbi:MAG TPA: LysR family transcriptional regulator, partial [Sphingomonas bacterium]|nr:LysR family transcriptional regulator [Sphingomonas bacterium]